jgi:hypothetical protein
VHQRTRTLRPLILSVVFLVALSGCGFGVAVDHGGKIPAGAQLVHLVATRAAVRLSPTGVRAGDIYVQLDDPVDDGSFSVVKRAATAEASPGPMDDNALERLAHGDTEGTSMEAFGPSCSGQNGSGIGIVAAPGICGNVWKLVLGPGRYAILGPAWTQQATEASVDPTAGPSGFVPPATMAVLEVLP